MGRAPCCEKVGLKRGRWTAEEDDILTKYIQTNGEGSWRSLPKNAGLLRCGKSCRLRWVNYLKSDLKRGKFSKDEDETIIKLHSSLGNRWCLIASHLPGRTDNEIKNYWNSHLSRQIYNFRKIIQQIKQTSVDQPIKLRSKITNSNIAPQRRVGRTSRSAMKKNKSHISAKPLSQKSVELTSSSQQGDCGAGDASVLMPATPALEENVVSCMLMEMDKDNESMDDILLGSYFDNKVFDELEVGPTEVPGAQGLSHHQGEDQNSEILFSNEEVENWLIDTNFRMQSSGDLSLVSDGGDQLYQCDTKYTSPYDELDIFGWDMGNLDWDSGIIDQDQKLWDSEEEKLLSWLWGSSSDVCDDGDGSMSKVESESDSDKHDAIVEWLLS